ncbi:MULTISPECIES: hypothetical protein [Streptomyces]|uniref:Secreted protein n=1 Tax=Streptomyces griseiscabiei TaxID=2993540 RepID=A0ABU4L234_9ACTN|nr:MULTISPECIES: hypothetical protein [Streptomyces]MBZ3906122.1 hypothetical protein [Streptomyces griseiscabiei]MDX2909756.1 hypothetical protein [Streptomyces griseiscabiei]
MLSTALAGGTAVADEVGTMAQGGKCTYNQLGKPAIRSHKGKGDDRYNDGRTKKYGRELILSTGTAISDDNSAAMLSGKVSKDDEVWVDISHDKGKNWKGPCGKVKAAKKGEKIYSKWFAHYREDITKRVIRACARTTSGADGTGKRVTWCADIGDVKNGVARWWSDKD